MQSPTPYDEKQLNTLELMRLRFAQWAKAQSHYNYQSEIHRTLSHLMHSIIQLHEANSGGWSEENLLMLAAYLMQWKALKMQMQESAQKSIELGIYENLYR